MEVYNDLHEDLVHLFATLRDRPKAIKLHAALLLTPYHESEFHRAWDSARPTEDVERARWTMIRLRMAFGGCGSRDAKPGFAFGKSVNCALSWSRKIDDLEPIVDRLRRVTIMSRDAIDVIKKFDSEDTLHYCDPPYVHQARKDSKAYRHEMDDEAHERLAAVLNSVSGKVVLSGYDSKLYRKLYSGWRTDSRIQKLQCSRDKSQSRKETVWMNF